MDKRRFARVSMMAELAYAVEGSEGITITKRVSDLSEGGLFVDTPVPAEVGTVIELRFNVGAESVVATGRVAYSQAFIGMGVEFTRIEPRLLEVIRSHVARHAPALVAAAPD